MGRKGGRGRRRARQAVRTLLPQLPSFLRLLVRLFLDRRVSLLDKGMLVGVVLYVLMPLDLVPDFLGVLGMADDLFLLGLAIRRLVSRAGDEVVAEHWTGDGKGLRELTGGLDDLGPLVPGPVQRALTAYARRWRDS